jgi:hypothetical protein
MELILKSESVWIATSRKQDVMIGLIYLISCYDRMDFHVTPYLLPYIYPLVILVKGKGNVVFSLF